MLNNISNVLFGILFVIIIVFYVFSYPLELLSIVTVSIITFYLYDKLFLERKRKDYRQNPNKLYFDLMKAYEKTPEYKAFKKVINNYILRTKQIYKETSEHMDFHTKEKHYKAYIKRKQDLHKTAQWKLWQKARDKKINHGKVFESYLNGLI